MKGKSGNACRLLTPDEYGREFGPGRILFVRHGEKTGHSRDADLTESGCEAAIEAGILVRRKPDMFLASPAVRAIHTVECMREGMGSEAPMEVLGCLRGLPVKDKPAWSALKKSEGRLEALAMWRDGKVSKDVLPPFDTVAGEFLDELLSAIPDEGSVIAGTHDHQMRFIALMMDSKLDGTIGYLDGIMFDTKSLFLKQGDFQKKF